MLKRYALGLMFTALLLEFSIPNAVLASIPSNSNYYHPDHLGSSIAMTDVIGAVVSRLENLPYGEFGSGSSTVSNSQFHTTYGNNSIR